MIKKKGFKLPADTPLVGYKAVEQKAKDQKRAKIASDNVKRKPRVKKQA
jgi:hypothetical protein